MTIQITNDEARAMLKEAVCKKFGLKSEQWIPFIRIEDGEVVIELKEDDF